MEYEIVNRDEIEKLYGNKYVALSNALIQARAKANLLEGKIELLAIYRMNDEMHTKTKVDAHGKEYDVHYVQLTSSEIRNMIGRKGGGLYSQLEDAALEMKQKVYIYKDDENNEFTMKSLYGDVDYHDGRLTIEFNPDTEKLFLSLKNNFTKLRLDIAFVFQSNGGFQLYKLLKSHAYKLPLIDLDIDQKDLPSLTLEWSITELRMELGYVDLNQPNLRREGAKRNPDIEKMAALERKPKYARWTDFTNRVLNPGIDEVNRISDIYIASIEKICGQHGRVERVSITIQHNSNFYRNEKNDKRKPGTEKKVRLSEDEKLDFYMNVRDIIHEKLNSKDLSAICNAANWNLDRIQKAYQSASASGSEIQNLVGYLVAAIKGDYSDPVKKKADNFASDRTDRSKKTTNGRKKAKNTFTEFHQREYDWDELENNLQKSNASSSESLDENWIEREKDILNSFSKNHD